MGIRQIPSQSEVLTSKMIGILWKLSIIEAMTHKEYQPIYEKIKWKKW